MSKVIQEEIDRRNGILNFGSVFFGPFFLLFNGRVYEGLFWLFGLPIISNVLTFFIDDFVWLFCCQ